MPWCPTCDRFLSPPSVTVEGTCPRCGQVVDPGLGHPPAKAPDPPANADPSPEASPESGAGPAGADDEDLGPIPWHLKLLAGAVALYLGYRAFQGIEWIVHRF